MVGMDAGRGEEPPWFALGQPHGVQAALVTAASNNHARHTCVMRSLHHVGPIVIETVVCQVGAYIDQFKRQFFSPYCNQMATGCI
jgi:hypothetical protein